jgi:hypothetical protein
MLLIVIDRPFRREKKREWPSMEFFFLNMLRFMGKSFPSSTDV